MISNDIFTKTFFPNVDFNNYINYYHLIKLTRRIEKCFAKFFFGFFPKIRSHVKNSTNSWRNAIKAKQSLILNMIYFKIHQTQLFLLD